MNVFLWYFAYSYLSELMIGALSFWWHLDRKGWLTFASVGRPFNDQQYAESGMCVTWSEWGDWVNEKFSSDVKYVNFSRRRKVFYRDSHLCCRLFIFHFISPPPTLPCLHPLLLHPLSCSVLSSSSSGPRLITLSLHKVISLFLLNPPPSPSPPPPSSSASAISFSPLENLSKNVA